MRNITLYTSSFKILKILNEIYKITKVYSEINENQIKRFCKKNNIKFSLYKQNKIENDLVPTELAITYGYNKIISKKIIKFYKMGIWNIHPGELPAYRGRHPISWAIMNNEKKIGISVHKINHEIDKGYLLSKTFVPRIRSDNENDIKNKMFKKIKFLLNLAEKNFKKKKLLKLSNGKYYKSLKNGVTIYQPSNYRFEKLLNIIKSQEIYKGIKIKNKYYKKIKILKNSLMINNKNIFLNKDNKIIKLYN